MVVVIPAAVLGLLKLISWISGIVFVSGYIRDSVVKTKETDIQLSQDKTVDAILAREDLAPEMRTSLLKEYLGIKDDDISDALNKILTVVVVLAVLYMILQIFAARGK